MRPIYSIGHSTRTYEELVATLRAWHVDTLADIRSFRASRTNPQFDEAALASRLAADGIAYRAVPALGGRRRKSHVVPAADNAGWDNAAFKNYADHAETADFAAGLAELVAMAATATTAMMCSEAVWWRCHRRIVADHLLARGLTVIHLYSATRSAPATLTPFARVAGERVTYPASDAGAAAL